MRHVTRIDIRTIHALLNSVNSKRAQKAKYELERVANRPVPLINDVENRLEIGREIMEAAQVSNPSLWTSVFFECSVILEYSMTAGISKELKDKLKQVYDKITALMTGGPEFLKTASEEINSTYAMLFRRDRNLYRRPNRSAGYFNTKDIQTFNKFRKERIDHLKALSIIDTWRRDARGESLFYGDKLRITGDRRNHSERMKITSLYADALTRDLHVSVPNFIGTMMVRIRDAESIVSARDKSTRAEAFLLTRGLLNPHHDSTLKLYAHLDHLDLLLEKIGVNKI